MANLHWLAFKCTSSKDFCKSTCLFCERILQNSFQWALLVGRSANARSNVGSFAHASSRDRVVV